MHSSSRKRTSRVSDSKTTMSIPFVANSVSLGYESR